MRQLIALAAFLALAACGSPSPNATDEAGTESSTFQTTRSGCQAKGEAYFREIEAWPTLSDGRNAAEVAADRCGRTTGAFDGLT